MLRLFSRFNGERFNSGLPSRRWHSTENAFKNVSDEMNMNKDGSVTAVNFKIAPPAGQIWVIEFISLLLIDQGDMIPSSFGSIAGSLANGLQVYSKIDGVEREMTNIQSNKGLLQRFFGSRVGSRGGGVGTDSGFLNTVDYVAGQMRLSGGAELILNGDNSDELGFKVRDNLTAIDTLEAVCRYRFDIDR